MPLTLDDDFLLAALAGYQERLTQVEAQIFEVSRKLGVARGASSAVTAAPAKKKRVLSDEGRAHIIAALEKRWGAVRKAKAASARKRKQTAQATAAPKPARIKKAVQRPSARKTPVAEPVEPPISEASAPAEANAATTE